MYTIVKTSTLHAPLENVWRALGDAATFGTWFGLTLDGPFVEGSTVAGKIAQTQVDDEVARHQAPYVGMRCDLMIEQVAPLERLAFRWRPDAENDTGPDAPTTLVAFELEEVPGGTRLTITESGFDSLPPERQEVVMAGNEGGWTIQLSLIAKHLARRE